MGGDYLHSPPRPSLVRSKSSAPDPASGKPSPVRAAPRARAWTGAAGASGERRAEISLVLAGNSRRQGGRVSLGTLETQRVYNAWVASSKCIKSIRRPPATALLRRAHARARCRGLATYRRNSQHASTILRKWHYLLRLGGAPPHEARHRDAAAEELPPPPERSRIARHGSHAC